MFTLYLFIYVVIVLSAVVHEYAHGLVAYRLGDRTARDMGRLTLNPLAHVDLMGTVIVPVALLFISGIFIGWAKPVPYNPYALSDKKYGSLKVAAAGPLSNLCVAVVLSVVLHIVLLLGYNPGALAIELWGFVVYVNIFLALFNLIPVPPLDGSKILFDLAPSVRFAMSRLGFLGLFIALAAAFYVLPPIARLFFSLLMGGLV